MRSLASSLFGSPGWGWVVWHLVLLVTLLPCAYLLWYLRMPSPERGQRSLAAALALLLFLAGLTLVTLIHTILVARTLQGPAFARYLKAVSVWLLSWPVVAVLLGILANRADVAGIGLAARRLALMGFLLLVAAVYAANLVMLARVRAHGAVREYRSGDRHSSVRHATRCGR